MSSSVSSALPQSNKAYLGQNIAILVCPAPNGKNFAVTIDREDLERVQAAGFWRVANFRKWIGQVGLYCYTMVNGKNVYLHRFISGAQRGQVVDHRNNRRLDNRKSEIRICGQGLNQLNRIYGGHGRSGLRGVYPSRSGSGKWFARVRLNNKRHSLGVFSDPQEAAERVRQFLIEHGAAYAVGGQK